MSKTNKIVLLTATLWPFVFMVLFFIVWISMFTYAVTSGSNAHAQSHQAPPGFPGTLFLVFGLAMLTMLDGLILTIVYIIDVFRNPRIANDYRVLWALVIFLGGPIGMIVYWYVNLWRDPVALPPAPLEQG